MDQKRKNLIYNKPADELCISEFLFGGFGASSEPCCIAVSRDDTKLAIGARDRLGCVYEYDLNSGSDLGFLD